jgi:hypothetical protein
MIILIIIYSVVALGTIYFLMLIKNMQSKDLRIGNLFGVKVLIEV